MTTQSMHLELDDTAGADCFHCQIDNHVKVWGWDHITDKQTSIWMMWGCTCKPEDAEAAMEYINLVTR